MDTLSNGNIRPDDPKVDQTSSDASDPFLIPKYAGSHRISAQYQRRTQIQYAVLAITGLGIFYNFTNPRLRVAGLACIFPGAGFLAVGGITGLVGLVVSLAFLPLSLFAWFGAGGLAFVIANWVLPGFFAVLLTGESIWELSAPISVTSIAGLMIWGSLASQKERAELLQRGERINAFLRKEKITLENQDKDEPDADEKRELSEEQMRQFQFVLELLFQEFGDWSNYDRIDQFQTAALRYQLYNMQWTTSFVHKYYMPSFQGYIKTAHERAVEKSLTADVMGYWKWESLWGKFTLDWDPVKRDNIMVTGYILLCLSLYQKLTGDTRYEADGSLNFQITETASYRHSTRTIFEALMSNWNSCSYTLFPCEPNWIYPICNMQGAEGATAYESVKKTGLVKPLISGRFRRAFEEDFVGPDGRVVPIRSAITGYCIPNLAGVLSDLGSALIAASSAPNLARRVFLAAKENHLKKDEKGRWSLINLVGADQIDPGNYKKGPGLGYSATACLAGELGQKEIHHDLLNRLNRETNPLEPVPWGSGALRNKGLSVLATSGTVKATLIRRGDWHNLVNCDVDERVMAAPKLTDVPFPDVMVARCHPDGDGIDFVLRACTAPVVSTTIGFKDLQNGVRYKIVALKDGEETDVVTGILARGNGCADAQVEVEGRSEFLLRTEA